MDQTAGPAVCKALCPLKEDSVIQTGREPLSGTHEDFMDGCNAKPVNGTV